MIEPQKWASALGSLSDTVTLPDEDLQFASFKKLFPALTQVPLSEGGVAPQRTDFNTLFKLLGDNIFYIQQGGVFSYSDTADYERGAFVKYNNELYLCIKANGTSSRVKAPTDAKYWLRVALNNDLANYLPLAGGNLTGNLTVQNKNVVRSVNGVNANEIGNVQLGNIVAITGEIKWYAFNKAPDGYLVCNGASVSRTTYADLFKAIGTTFGSGNGSTTFNLPDLRDRYIIGASTNALGTKIAEQLPNIKGGLESDFYGHLLAGSDSTRQYGAITYIEKRIASGNVGTSASNVTSFTLDAHNSNSIYTDDGHVYPLSLALLPCIKY